jgi:hypothetical protein
MDPKEKELDSLPVGLVIAHAPHPVKARAGGRSGYPYTWTYRTSVRSTAGTLTVQEFGSFSWFGGRWVFSNFTGRPFTPQDFAEWYSCPGARLEPGKAYADPSNWSGGQELIASRAKWYFVAIDENGRRVKGEAVVEQAAELAE